MTSIEAVRTAASRVAAVALFAEYGEFLRETQSCGHFNHRHFLEETATLPAAYAEHRGEVLLACVDSAVAGCVAYRESTYEGAESCEIKRLFVRPEWRGHGLARQLVQETLHRARRLGYTRAVLDTDLAHMPGAAELYASFGFQERGERRGSIAFYELPLRA